MKKYIVIGSGAVVLGVIVAIVLAVLNLGTLIKTVTEEYGPKITKTDVKLGSADISILSGSGTLENFLLGNPKGFTMPEALVCDVIRVKVVKESLTTDKIIIEEIYVDGPIISYEKKGNTDNFNTIVNNIKKTVAGEKKEAKTEKAEEPSDSGSGKTIQINNFIVKNGKINLGGSLLSAFGDNGMGMDLPDVHIKNIGKDSEISPAEAFAFILGVMTSDVSGTVSQVGKKLQENLGKAVEGGAESVGGVIKGLFGD